MPRSLKKGPYVHPKLMEKIVKLGAAKGVVTTWSRASTILPDMVGFTIKIHNGKTFDDLFVTEEMVGHKLGEFSRSTKFKNHGGKDAKK